MSLKEVPEGWTDPNRGWDNNVTLAKKHLVKIVDEQPDFLIFNHDWSDKLGIVMYYGE